MALETVTFPIKSIVRTHFTINCVLVLLTVVVVILRMVSRYINRAKLWWDDYLILLTVPQGITMLVIQGLYMPMGVGYPIAETLPNLEIILKLMVAYALIYTSCISFIKLSVLLFYLRVFVNDGLRLATKISLGFVGAWTTANILMLFLICRPFAANYDLSIEDGECGDQPKAFISIGAFNIISDVIILLLPIPTVWNLKTRRQMKIALTCVFLIGLLVSIVAVGRIFSLEYLDLANITETMIWVDFLSTTEINLGILCVSLPMLGPIVTRFIRRKGASRLDNSPSGGHLYDRPSKATGGNRRQHLGDSMTLDSIYAPDMEPHHDVSVTAAGSRDKNETLSHVGSEASLSPLPKIEQEGDDFNTIRVHQQWDIRHS